MSETSWIWGCGIGDGSATGTSIELMNAAYSFLGNLNPDDSGVIYWTETNTAALQLSANGLTNAPTGLLDASESGGVVTIESGAAVVTGWFYVSDDTTDFDINSAPGAASATDIIALRRDATAGTVRLVRLNGAAGATATLTQTTDVWEIPLWYVVLDASGEFSSLYNGRKCNETMLSFEIDSPSFDTDIELPGIFTNWIVRGTMQSSTTDTVGIEFNGDDSADSHSFRRWHYDDTFTFQSDQDTFNNVVVQPYANNSATQILLDFEMTISYPILFSGIETFLTVPRLSWRGFTTFANSIGDTTPDGDFFANGCYNGQGYPETFQFKANGGGSNPSISNLTITGFN